MLTVTEAAAAAACQRDSAPWTAASSPHNVNTATMEPANAHFTLDR